MDPQSLIDFAKASGVYGLMHTSWGWPVVEILHYFGLTVLIATVGLFDLRLLGVAKSIPITALHRLVPLGVAAFVANIVTGAMFFISAADQYMYNPAFQLKVACIAIAGVNVVVFYRFAAASLKTGVADAPPLAKVLAGVSLTAWVCVIMFGRLITYFRPPYAWCFWC